MDVIVGGELFTDYSDHPRKLVTLNPKPNRAGRYQLLSRWWDARCKKPFPKDFSPRQDAVALQQIKERGALPMIDRGDILVRQSTVAAISGLHSPGAGYGWFEHKADSLIAKNSKKRAERSERLMYEQSHRDYLRSGYLHHRLPVMGQRPLP